MNNYYIIGLLVVLVFISGCVQQPSGEAGGTTGQAARTAEDQAYNAIDQEVQQAVENMTDEEIENALLNQR